MSAILRKLDVLARGREVYVGEIAHVDDWPEAFAEPSCPFVALTVVDAGNYSGDDLMRLGSRLLRQGCVDACSWAWLRASGDAFDAARPSDVLMAAGAPDFSTEWFEGDPIEEALWYAITVAGDPDVVEDPALVIVVERRWLPEVLRAMQDPSAFCLALEESEEEHVADAPRSQSGGSRIREWRSRKVFRAS